MAKNWIAGAIKNKGALRKTLGVSKTTGKIPMSKIKKAEKGLKEFVHAWQRGDLELENLPSNLRTALANLLREQQNSENETE